MNSTDTRTYTPEEASMLVSGMSIEKNTKKSHLPDNTLWMLEFPESQGGNREE